MIRRKNVWAVMLSGLLLALSMSAFADSMADARKAITSIYHQQVTALEHKNLNGAFSHLAPDYVSIDLKGYKTTAAADRKNATSMLTGAKSLHVTLTILQFSMKNNLAIATVKEHVSAVLVEPSSQKTMAIEDTKTSKDTWIKTKTGWLGKRSQEISEKATVNGQLVPQQ